VGCKGFAVIKDDGVMVQPRFNSNNLAVHHLKIIGGGMLGKFHGQFRAADLFGAGPVLHLVGVVELASGDALFDEQCFQGGPLGIDACGIAARAAADDDKVVGCGIRHGVIS